MRIALFCCACLCWFRLAHAGDKDAYEVKGTPAGIEGGKGTASVTILAKPGWHINEKAPLSLVVTPPSGVVLRKAKLVRTDLAVNTREKARFDIPVSCKEPGAKSMMVEAKFVICKAESCNPQRETLTIAVNAAAGVRTSNK